jgi:hypothetical protein
MRVCEEELSWRMREAVRLYGRSRGAYPFDMAIGVELDGFVIVRAWMDDDYPKTEHYIVYAVGGPTVYREVNGTPACGAEPAVIEDVTARLRRLMILDDLAKI